MTAAVMTPQADPHQRGEPKLKTITDFAGVNLRANRQSIDDSEFSWLENVQPIGPGNLRVVAPPSGTLQTISSQTPVAAWAFNLSGVDYDFVVMSSGHIYQVKKTTPYTATQITSVSGAIFGSGQTALAQWGNTIILVVDPTSGYWYWNGSTLTAISNTVAYVTIDDPGVYAGTPPTVSFSGGGGVSAAATVAMGIITVKVNAAGTLYTVGDLLAVNAGGLGVTHNVVKVETVTAGGVVATLSVVTPGEYIGAVGVTNLTTSGGTGSGCTVDVTWGVTSITMTNQGSSYTSAPGVVFTGGAPTRTAAATATVSGALLGSSIATYAARVWIGSGRTVSFTDVDSYTSFAGAGGALTIDDQTLHGNITALFTANSFLYIAGDDSFDILGDVQVSSGVTSFTRQNVEASVGTTLPGSIFSYYRSIYFANTSGFWSLSGSTPQKLSDNLDPLFPYIDFTKPVTGGQVMIRNILCPAFLFTFSDVFTGGGTRPLLAVLCQNKWFFVDPGSAAKLLTSSPLSGVATGFIWTSGGSAILYQLFSSTATTLVQITIQTRLWDGDAPLFDKQVIRAAIGINWNGQDGTGAMLRVFTDNELSSPALCIFNNSVPSSNSYSLTVASSKTGGGKYFGLNVSSFFRQVIISLLALEWIDEKLL